MILSSSCGSSGKQSETKTEVILENNDWNTIAHIAMKKNDNKKVSIQINEAFYKAGNLHEIHIIYGTVE